MANFLCDLVHYTRKVTYTAFN
ncbi:hypothetical protein A5797_001665, partial [Enterococcus faecalis]